MAAETIALLTIAAFAGGLLVCHLTLENRRG